MTFSDIGLKQKTLKREVSASGVGLFSGARVNLTLCPAPENSGIIFQRVDIAGRPIMPAVLSSVDHKKDSLRSTLISKDGFCVQTVEHLLSTLNAYGVDNLLIQVDGPEIPITDGSAKIFVDLIEKGEVIVQSAPKKVLVVKEPIHWTEGESHLVALPLDEFRLSYILHYPRSKLLKSQYCTFSLQKGNYKDEIAPARTFSFYEDVEIMVKSGFVKGGGLENAVVIKDDCVLNPEGVRFEDEMVRHKILDLMGDLYLVGGVILGHVIAIRSGHFSNIAFAKKLVSSIK